MKKYRCLVLISLIIHSLTATGQLNLLPAKCLFNSGEQLSGDVQLRSNESNSKEISFRGALNSKDTILFPSKVKEVEVLGKVKFKSYPLKNSNGSIDTLFFELIVGGQKDLILLEGKSYFVFDNNASRVIELSNKEIRSSKSQIRLRATLNSIMKNEKEMLELIKSINTIDSKFLKKIFNQYNTNNGTINWESDLIRIPISINFGMNVGVRNANVIFKNAGFSNTSFTNSISPEIGANLELAFPKTNPGIKLLLACNYSKNDFYSFFNTASIFGATSINNDAFVSFSTINTSIKVKYTLSNKTGFFITGGIEHGHLMNKSVRWRQESISKSVITTEHILNFKPLSTSYLGYGLGLGKKIRFLSQFFTLEINYKHMYSGAQKEFVSEITSTNFNISYWIK